MVVGSKVADFDLESLADEAVPGGKVAMDEVQRFQVAHSGCDLAGDEDQTAHGKTVIGGNVALVLQELLLVELAVTFEELVQVAVLEVLQHHAERLLRRANAQNARQLRVVERCK